jgi:hypothetical protein
MKTLALCVAAFLVVLIAVVAAQTPVVVRPTPYSGSAYCQITSLSASTAIVTASCSTGSVLANPRIAQICVSGAAVRYTSNGPTPTASVGIPVAVGACYQYSGTFGSLRFIQQAANGILDIETFP